MPTYKIPLPPVPAARGAPGRYGFYYPARYSKFKKEAGRVIRDMFKGTAPLTSALKVGCDFICPRPKRTDRSWPPGDYDNLLKAIWDACNEVVWVDDDQITKMDKGEKRYAKPGEAPCIVLRVTEA